MLFSYSIAALRHCGIAALRHCGFAALRHCGFAALRHCGFAALRHCGVGAVRRFGFFRGRGWLAVIVAVCLAGVSPPAGAQDSPPVIEIRGDGDALTVSLTQPAASGGADFFVGAKCDDVDDHGVRLGALAAATRRSDFAFPDDGRRACVYLWAAEIAEGERETAITPVIPQDAAGRLFEFFVHADDRADVDSRRRYVSVGRGMAAEFAASIRHNAEEGDEIGITIAFANDAAPRFAGAAVTVRAFGEAAVGDYALRDSAGQVIAIDGELFAVTVAANASRAVFTVVIADDNEDIPARPGDFSNLGYEILSLQLQDSRGSGFAVAADANRENRVFLYEDGNKILFASGAATVTEGGFVDVTIQISPPPSRFYNSFGLSSGSVPGVANAAGNDWRFRRSSDACSVSGSGDHICREFLDSRQGAATVRVMARDDRAEEPAETLLLTMSIFGPSNHDRFILDPGGFTVVIAASDPRALLLSPSVPGQEGGEARITISLSAPADVAVSLTVGASAHLDDWDFILSDAQSGCAAVADDNHSCIAVFAAGEDRRIIAIAIADDEIDEGAEEIAFTFTGAARRLNFPDGEAAAVTIAPSDPRFLFAADGGIIGENGRLNITVTMSLPAAAAFSVTLSSSDNVDDWVFHNDNDGCAALADAALSCVVVVAEGEQSKVVGVMAVDDLVEEGQEVAHIIVAGERPAGSGFTFPEDDSFALTIRASDNAAGFAVAGVTAAEGALAEITLTLTRPAQSALSLTLQSLPESTAAAADWGYSAGCAVIPEQAGACVVSFAAAQQFATVTMRVVADGDAAEVSEQIVFNLASPAPYDYSLVDGGRFVVTIPPLRQSRVSVGELGGSQEEGRTTLLNFVFTPPPAAAHTLYLEGSNPDDWNFASGCADGGGDAVCPIEIAAGTASHQVGVLIVDDSGEEGTERAAFSFADAGDAFVFADTPIVLFIIPPSDPGGDNPISFAARRLSAAEGETPVITLALDTPLADSSTVRGSPQAFPGTVTLEADINANWDFAENGDCVSIVKNPPGRVGKVHCITEFEPAFRCEDTPATQGGISFCERVLGPETFRGKDIIYSGMCRYGERQEECQEITSLGADCRNTCYTAQQCLAEAEKIEDGELSEEDLRGLVTRTCARRPAGYTRNRYAAITINIFNDTVSEPAREYAISLYGDAPEDYIFAPSPGERAMTLAIAASDNPVLGFSSRAGIDINEGASAAFHLTLSSPSDVDGFLATVTSANDRPNWFFQSGCQQNYGNECVVAFPPNATESAPIVVQTIDDNRYEIGDPAELIAFTFAGAPAAPQYRFDSTADEFAVRIGPSDVPIYIEPATQTRTEGESAALRIVTARGVDLPTTGRTARLEVDEANTDAQIGEDWRFEATACRGDAAPADDNPCTVGLGIASPQRAITRRISIRTTRGDDEDEDDEKLTIRFVGQPHPPFVYDPARSSAEIIIQNRANVAPTANSDTLPLSAPRQTPYSRDLATHFTDPDGDALTCALTGGTSLPAGFALGGDNNCVLSGTPPAGNTADVTFQIIATDDNGAASSAVQIVLTLLGNRPPAASSNPLNIGEVLRGRPYTRDLAADFTDPEDDAITSCALAAETSPPTGLTLGGDTNCVLSGTPAALGDTADVTFQITATDAKGATSAPVQVMLKLVANRPPASAPINLSAIRETPYTYDFAADFADPEGDALASCALAAGASLPANLTLGGDKNCVLSGELAQATATDARFQITATDDKGATSAPVQIVIAISRPQNRAPIPIQATVYILATVGVNIAPYNIRDNFTDPDIFYGEDGLIQCNTPFPHPGRGLEIVSDPSLTRHSCVSSGVDLGQLNKCILRGAPTQKGRYEFGWGMRDCTEPSEARIVVLVLNRGESPPQLPAPANFTAAPTARNANADIALAWDAVDNAGSYQIYRDGALIHTAADGETTSHTDPSPGGVGRYNYTIIAVSAVPTASDSAPAAATAEIVALFGLNERLSPNVDFDAWQSDDFTGRNNIRRNSRGEIIQIEIGNGGTMGANSLPYTYTCIRGGGLSCFFQPSGIIIGGSILISPSASWTPPE